MKREQNKSIKNQESWDPGNILLLVYPLLIVCLLLAGLLVEARGTERGEITHEIDRLREGSLLFQTDGGKTIAAPRLSQNVNIDVSGIIARVIVAQKFINSSERWLEATYVFPLPDESMVDHMSLVVGERRITGKIMEKEEAAKTYKAAKKEGKKSSLLVQERPNVFTTKVANIGPGEEILVEIEYQQRVRLDSGTYSLRFPMVVGPRYVPGRKTVVTIEENEETLPGGKGRTVAGEVSEWLEVSSKVKGVGDADIPVQLTVDLVPGFSLKEIVSLYHIVDQKQVDEGHHLITFTGEVLADRDFVLQWKPELQTKVVTSVFAEKIGENQYMSLMLMPPQLKDEAALPREVVFVLDISGSMAGTSIVQAKDAISLALSRLDASDRFNLIVFNNSASSLFTASKSADAANIQNALSFVAGLKADGGTEMREALLLALDGSFRHELLRQVVFLTDGSVANEAELFGLINARLGDSRLFTVGIGSAPNSYFMSRAASMGRGTFTYVGKQDEVKQKMTELFAKIENPAITNLKISIDKPGVDVEIYPSPLPDLYYGEPLVIAMRSGWENLQLEVSGSSAGKTWATTVDTTVFGERSGVASFWARKKIRSLMESLALGGNKEEIRKEVVHTALQHHLMSKYTSLVAVDDRVVRPETEKQQESAVKNHLPQGWQPSAIYGGGSQTATPSSLACFTRLPTAYHLSISLYSIMSSRIIKYSIPFTLLLGCFSLLWGFWIPAKAIVAQVLLERAWNLSLKNGAPAKPWPWADCWPVGRLRQDRLRVDLIILEGVSGESLAFGPGRVEASGKVGGDNHIVLAGHRDTSFSFLKSLGEGDELVVESQSGEYVYTVSKTSVVPAKALYLDAKVHHTLSLVTCYPFDAIVPHTKMRYLVTAAGAIL